MIKPRAFFQQLEQGKLFPVYLFIGEAELLMEQAWHKLRAQLVPPKAERFNGESVSAREISAAEVGTRLATLPMFGRKRLIMVRHMEAWAKDQLAVISTYLARPNSSACLLLTTGQKKAPVELQAAVEAVGQVVEFAPPTDYELPKWLQEQAGQWQKQLTMPAANLLLERVGHQLHKLEGELEKVCLFVGERKRIEATDVEQVVSHQRHFSVFELLNCLGKCQADRAITILRRLLLAGEHPLPVLALMARQIRILWQVKDETQRGLDAKQISQKLQLSPYVVKKYLTSGQLFTEAALAQAHQAICGADLALKSSGATPEAILEALVLVLCRRQQKGPEAPASEPKSKRPANRRPAAV